MRHARGFLALLPLLLASCVSFTWYRTHSNEPSPKNALSTLVPGKSTLDECLQALGAPLYLWEYKGDGAALAWGWNDLNWKGVTLSVPIYDQTAASASYDYGAERMKGAVLLFDRDLVLESVREGWLRDLESELGRRRPAVVPATD
jgi:hypothetical protein